MEQTSWGFNIVSILVSNVSLSEPVIKMSDFRRIISLKGRRSINGTELIEGLSRMEYLAK